MSTTLQNVSGLLLNDGWHSVSLLATLPVAGPVKWPTAFTCRTREGYFLFGPLSSILAMRADRYVSPEEQAEEERQARDADERQFLWQHRATRDVYDAAFRAQDGLCGECGTTLQDWPITHFNEMTGKVLCQGCSPFQHRYGAGV